MPGDEVGHQGRGLRRELTVRLDPVTECVPRTPHIRHCDAHPNPIVESDLTAVHNLHPGDDEGYIGPSAEPFAPQLRPGGFEVGDDGRIVDVSEGVHVPPPHLDRAVKWVTLHGPQSSSPRPSGTIPTVTTSEQAPRIVTLWWTSVSAACPLLGPIRNLLAAAENRRADRFTVEDGRNRYLAAHGMLRLVIGRALEIAPTDVVLREGARGKPSLAPTSATPACHFNISHSGDAAVVAVAGAELGVDVEALRPLPRAVRLADRFFSDSERRWLLSRPTGSRDAAFLALWTAKEAYLKAVGSGIAMQLRKIEIDLDGPTITQIVGDPHEAERWTLLHAELPNRAFCSVAIRGQGWRLDVRRFDWDRVQSLKSKV